MRSSLPGRGDVDFERSADALREIPADTRPDEDQPLPRPADVPASISLPTWLAARTPVRRAAPPAAGAAAPAAGTAPDLRSGGGPAAPRTGVVQSPMSHSSMSAPRPGGLALHTVVGEVHMVVSARPVRCTGT
ncbi:hypothetical protein BJF90_00795 [Pseudonocardia sp. CNS-004]|nr:hypothetical protein BJF90_00795 [Pseudonocardia sp. CNS-004]